MFLRADSYKVFDHIFFYFVSSTTGFSFIKLVFFLWYKSKKEILKFFVFAMSTLILLEQMVTAYDIVILAGNADKIDNIIFKSMIIKILKLTLIMFPIMILDVLIDKAELINIRKIDIKLMKTITYSIFR